MYLSAVTTFGQNIFNLMQGNSILIATFDTSINKYLIRLLIIHTIHVIKLSFFLGSKSFEGGRNKPRIYVGEEFLPIPESSCYSRSHRQ